MKDMEITEEPIELCRILKFENMVASGGEAKHVIAEGLVKVNGEVETRKRKKIFSGDIIEFGDTKIRLQLKTVIL
jgi:ribosome-associated protein